MSTALLAMLLLTRNNTRTAWQVPVQHPLNRHLRSIDLKSLSDKRATLHPVSLMVSPRLGDISLCAGFSDDKIPSDPEKEPLPEVPSKQVDRRLVLEIIAIFVGSFCGGYGIGYLQDRVDEWQAAEKRKKWREFDRAFEASAKK
mmetsp:Transcript_155920/g.287405  ORF Transcript_155920/g.287405 Transcript_155920/m.287405 type:complete len:144 (+) Transcript_155920:73-504(+)